METVTVAPCAAVAYPTADISSAEFTALHCFREGAVAAGRVSA